MTIMIIIMAEKALVSTDFGWGKAFCDSWQELKKKYAHDHEIAALKNLLPGEGDPNAAGVAASQDSSDFLFASGSNVRRYLDVLHVLIFCISRFWSSSDSFWNIIRGESTLQHAMQHEAVFFFKSFFSNAAAPETLELRRTRCWRSRRTTRTGVWRPTGCSQQLTNQTLCLKTWPSCSPRSPPSRWSTCGTFWLLLGVKFQRYGCFMLFCCNKTNLRTKAPRVNI